MDPRVEAYIEKAKQEIAEKEAKERADFLVSIGLCEEQRVYCQTGHAKRSEYPFKEIINGQKWYYRNELVPFDISDEEYAELRKYAATLNPQKEKTYSHALKNSSYSSLPEIYNFFSALLLLGCFASCSVAFYSHGDWSLITELLIIALTCLIAAAMLFAFGKIIDYLDRIAAHTSGYEYNAELTE